MLSLNHWLEAQACCILQAAIHLNGTTEASPWQTEIVATCIGLIGLLSGTLLFVCGSRERVAVSCNENMTCKQRLQVLLRNVYRECAPKYK